jgi:glutamate synthase (NADPH/NADH) large chain
VDEGAAGKWADKTARKPIAESLDARVLKDAVRFLDRGQTLELSYPLNNTQRTVGAAVSSAIVRRFGSQGPAGRLKLRLEGIAGQSFGAFAAKGLELHLTGEANDYVGKGLCGGKIIVKPTSAFRGTPRENIIVGNTVLYGAIAGEAYFNGVAGERFAVRNSGAIAVVEGAGDHACEYMTGGVVVVLGKTGRNFAAGMSGGVAYVYDPDGAFTNLVNHAQVDLLPIAAGPDAEDGTGRPAQRPRSVNDFGMGDMLRHDAERLRILVERHQLHTGSMLAGALLADWDAALTRFVKVMPRDYAAALQRLEAERNEAASVAAE